MRDTSVPVNDSIPFAARFLARRTTTPPVPIPTASAPSWWVGLAPAAFYTRVHAEEARILAEGQRWANLSAGPVTFDGASR